jgi:hypothetical protein
MIVSVDTFIASQGKGNFYVVDDDIITGRDDDDHIFDGEGSNYEE